MILEFEINKTDIHDITTDDITKIILKNQYHTVELNNDKKLTVDDVKQLGITFGGSLVNKTKSKKRKRYNIRKKKTRVKR
jgi:hypothetical protein